MPIINNASPKTLAAVFDRAAFLIPRYQRAYAWDESNWKELWDDILNNVSSRDRELFLGAIIYYHTNPQGLINSQYSIIDGQQRLTTISILMRVLYEKMHAVNIEVYSRFADELYEKYIGNKKNGSYLLTLSKKDESFFRDYIQKEIPLRRAKGKLVSNKNIRKCYDFFSSEVEKLNDGNPGLFGETCYELKKKIERDLTFVVIDVSTDVDAYVIFESINSKRQGLTIADLLKNYLFLAADQFEKSNPDSRQLSLAEGGWEKIEQSLDKIEPGQYIRHFWISCYGKVSEKELYQKIKEKFGTNVSEILSFLEQLTDEVETYASIVNANILDFPAEGIKALRQLQNLRNKQYYPLILSAISSDYNSEEVSRLVCQVASVAVRRALVGKNPNELESFFAKNALELRKGSIAPAQLIEELGSNSYWISDDEIISEIGRLNFEDQEYLAKFILQEFEQSRTVGEKTLDKVSLEHVLPRNPEALEDWGMDIEKHQEMVWNIGNLALIGQKYNSKMSNKNFEVKKIHLRKTEIKTTVNIADLDFWDEEAIVARNQKIGIFFVRWWSNLSLK